MLIKVGNLNPVTDRHSVYTGRHSGQTALRRHEGPRLQAIMLIVVADNQYCTTLVLVIERSNL